MMMMMILVWWTFFWGAALKIFQVVHITLSHVKVLYILASCIIYPYNRTWTQLKKKIMLKRYDTCYGINFATEIWQQRKPQKLGLLAKKLMQFSRSSTMDRPSHSKVPGCKLVMFSMIRWKDCIELKWIEYCVLKSTKYFRILHIYKLCIRITCTESCKTVLSCNLDMIRHSLAVRRPIQQHIKRTRGLKTVVEGPGTWQGRFLMMGSGLAGRLPSQIEVKNRPVSDWGCGWWWLKNHEVLLQKSFEDGWRWHGLVFGMARREVGLLIPVRILAAMVPFWLVWLVLRLKHLVCEFGIVWHSFPLLSLCGPKTLWFRVSF